MVPETWVQVAVTVAAVIPGFVFQVSRRGVAGPGPDEHDVSIRVLRSIAASAVFAGVYAILWGETIAPYLDKFRPYRARWWSAVPRVPCGSECPVCASLSHGRRRPERVKQNRRMVECELNRLGTPLGHT